MPLQPIERLPDKPCRHERCRIVDAHPAHDADFDRTYRGPRLPGDKPTPRRPRTKAELLALIKRPKIIRHDPTPRGPIAIVSCESCAGPSCRICGGRGELPLHHWRWFKAQARPAIGAPPTKRT